MIELDGSAGEGGGQILRSALTLSLLTGKAFRLANIRARRPQPGLKAQHLASVRAAATIGNAQVLGASLNSSLVTFVPGAVTAGDYRFPVGTAGSVALVLHAVYLPLALRGDKPSTLTIEGGTHVMAAPVFEYLTTTWASHLRRMGLEIDLEIERHGFYPRGGGLVRAVVHPWKTFRRWQPPSPVQEPQVDGTVIVSELPENVANRLGHSFEQRLRALRLEGNLDAVRLRGSPGCCVTGTVWQTGVPALFSSLGERGLSSEKVVGALIAQVKAFIDGAAGIDEHAADQLLLPLACQPHEARFEVASVSGHLLTNLETLRAFTDRNVTLTGEAGQRGEVAFAAATPEGGL